MTRTDFNKLVKEVTVLCAPYIEKGYVLTSKKGVEEVDNMFSYEANLKKGNVNILIVILDGGMSSLTRLNSYTHMKQECYFGQSLFTKEDLRSAIAFNFPMPEQF